MRFVKQRVFKIMLEIQKVHDRTPFARQWLNSARKQQETSQVFSAFFSAYIALAVCSTQIMGDNNGKVPKGDDEKWEGKAIEEAMKIKSQEIAVFLDSDTGKQIKVAILQREIPENENNKIIGPANDAELQLAAKNLAKYFSPIRSASLDENERIDQARQLAIVFRKVRNRLFHGGKMNDPNGSDAEFLYKLNPLLIEVVEILQKH